MNRAIRDRISLAEDNEDLMHKVSVRNSEVIENLGQLDLLLTDKTGTLTSNNMRIKRIYCDKKIFGIDPSEVTFDD